MYSLIKITENCRIGTNQLKLVLVFYSINKTTGEIKINSTLNYQMASVIVLTIRAVDANAVENVQEQFDEVEITFFVKPHQNKNPVFVNAGWSVDDSSTMTVKVDEETPIGSELVQLKAVDVLTNESLYDFKAVTAVPRQIAMDYAGKVILTERLDYETLETKVRNSWRFFNKCNKYFHESHSSIRLFRVSKLPL